MLCKRRSTTQLHGAFLDHVFNSLTCVSSDSDWCYGLTRLLPRRFPLVRAERPPDGLCVVIQYGLFLYVKVKLGSQSSNLNNYSKPLLSYALDGQLRYPFGRDGDLSIPLIQLLFEHKASIDEGIVSRPAWSHVADRLKENCRKNANRNGQP
jgi:hypothetical protein